ncbi:alpha/beta fold hydrolase [Mycobacterium montefiorense]|uniref:alpha/beta fold hydrolase n=1 Tax=Mycobacterium montefiorense TaxID=154654 RepID=UPI0021DF064A|nr:alpha/beta fold hydrolase [Mycobacterium montefiorense]GLE52722.1 hypothetical protein ATCCBAA256_22860 [Mycobacterium montefiorense]
MTTDLHVHRFGPAGPVQLLALHGLTGHGQRWQQVGDYVPEISIAAPDLLGHGRSSWAAPWTIDANVTALGALLDEVAQAPVLIVGHSFGGGLAMHLAAVRPDLVAALLLLDPAIGLDGGWMRDIAEAMFSSPTTRIHPKLAWKRPRAHGRTSMRMCSMPSWTSIWSRCPTDATAGGSACRR